MQELTAYKVKVEAAEPEKMKSKTTLLHQMLKVSFYNLFYSVLVFNNQLNKLIHSSILIKVEKGGRNILAVAGSLNFSFSVSTNFFHI